MKCFRHNLLKKSTLREKNVKMRDRGEIPHLIMRTWTPPTHVGPEDFRGRKVTDPTSSAADVCRAGSRARLVLKDTSWCFPHFPLQPEAGFVFLAVLGLSYCTWDLVPRPGNRPRPRAWGPWGSQPPPGIPEWGPALWDGAGRGSPPPCHTSAPGRGS